MDLNNTFRLDGKVAIVTGASYGLGVLFADVLASAGADVVVTARSKDKLEDTKRLVEGLGRRCVAVTGDVTIYEDCEAVVREAMTAFGHIDILVNNAGWADDRLVRTERCEPEMFAKMVGTDLVGLFYMTRAAAPEMLRGRRRQCDQPLVDLRQRRSGEPHRRLLRSEGRREPADKVARVRVG